MPGVHSVGARLRCACLTVVMTTGLLLVASGASPVGASTFTNVDETGGRPSGRSNWLVQFPVEEAPAEGGTWAPTRDEFYGPRSKKVFLDVLGNDENKTGKRLALKSVWADDVPASIVGNRVVLKTPAVEQKIGFKYCAGLNGTAKQDQCQWSDFGAVTDATRVRVEAKAKNPWMKDIALEVDGLVDAALASGSTGRDVEQINQLWQWIGEQADIYFAAVEAHAIEMACAAFFSETQYAAFGKFLAVTVGGSLKLTAATFAIAGLELDLISGNLEPGEIDRVKSAYGVDDTPSSVKATVKSYVDAVKYSKAAGELLATGKVPTALFCTKALNAGVRIAEFFE